MEAINTKAMKGIKSYLERRGFDILEERWAHGGDIIDFIASEEDDLVFISCQLRRNSGEGFPEEVLAAVPSSDWRQPTSPSTSTPRTSGSGSTS